jgi:CheY-like chemotaxis protein
MRADFALWASVTQDHRLDAEFRDAATTFIRLNLPRDFWSLRGPTDYVDAAWDRQTIHGFYFALYCMAAPITRATWFPYEVDPLLRFYELQDSLRDPLTPLDREVLASSLRRRRTKEQLVDIVHAHVGVTYDIECLGTHRSLLLAGAPTAPAPARLQPSPGRLAGVGSSGAPAHYLPGDGSVLLVADERELRLEISGALSQAGYRVVTARNGARALLSMLQSPPALVLLDMRPPYADARTFAENARAHGVQAPILVMANAREGRRAADEVGARSWIERPFGLDGLVRAVKRALR